jgi:hypothetical protein
MTSSTKSTDVASIMHDAQSGTSTVLTLRILVFSDDTAHRIVDRLHPTWCLNCQGLRYPRNWRHHIHSKCWCQLTLLKRPASQKTIISSTHHISWNFRDQHDEQSLFSVVITYMPSYWFKYCQGRIRGEVCLMCSKVQSHTIKEMFCADYMKGKMTMWGCLSSLVHSAMAY